MAKKTAGQNKSKAIRDYYAANPKAKPMEVADALKAQGIIVTPAFVSTIRSTSKKKKVIGKPGRPAGSTKSVTKKVGRPAGAASAVSAADSVSINALLKVKSMVEAVGSIEETRAALSALEKLMK
jgi:hypothetical protein